MSAKIGVFPASGGLGSSIIRHLLQLVPASLLVLAARDPEKLTGLSGAGATVIRADYDDPSTLERAFDNVGVLMLISYPSIEIEHRAECHKRAIIAARRSDVKHIMYTSLAFGGDLEESSVANVMGAHLQTERFLSELPGKFTYTAIREGLYSESSPLYTAWMGSADPSNEVTIPHDGSGPGVAWAKQDELGEATAKLVVSYAKNPEAFPYLNRVMLLSGPREVSLKETVDAMGRAIGKPVRIRQVSVDEYVSRLSSFEGRNKYVDLARDWATVWEAIRRGEAAVVTPVLGELLGREPEDFETTVRKMSSNLR